MSKARELSQRAGVDGALSNRNLIINGAMQVAQRGTSFANPQGYTLDRWKSLRYAANNYGVSQQDTGGLSKFSKCIRVQRTAGDTTSGNNPIALNQPVEQKNCEALVGQTVTLSFWVRVGADFSASPTYFKSVVAYTTNATDVGMYYDNFYSNGVPLSQALPISTSWTYVTMTVAIPSSAKQVGVAFIADYWTGTAGANDYYEITGVQLEVGDTATPFEHRSYGQELALCQRYLYRMGGASYTRIGTGYSYGTTAHNTPIALPTAMRALPTLTTSSLSGGSTFVVYQGAANLQAVSALVIESGGSDPTTRLSINSTVASVTQGDVGILVTNNNTSAFLEFDAEL